jgi:hypothetical protein
MIAEYLEQTGVLSQWPVLDLRVAQFGQYRERFLLNNLPSNRLYLSGSPTAVRFPMCDKCDELDKKIEHYRRIRLSIGDPVTIERIEALIADLQAQKATLHPEQKQ